ncbi:PREDICTED: uncharacterized protein LOC105449731 [Wasmannia auropunctata]|uniref:uncharacterized protein LOC105449731 n=1 Tax=Wasmannia auropunctata TaxID=64793 RepID=UPI0005EFA7FE|nr:PREDICTED: uncharacterized protein LOC105449731 [Wasmannia auropunctata]
MNKDGSKHKKRIYKYFLDPTYKPSQVDPRTDKRWRNILSTTDINNELADNTSNFKDHLTDGSFSPLHNESNKFDQVSLISNMIFTLKDEDSENLSINSECYQESDSNTSNIFLENSCDNLSSEIRNETIMFEAAGLTISDVLMMITGICLRYNLSNSAKHAIIKLVKVLVGPKFVAWKVNSYNILQQCSPPDDKILYTFYCTKCYLKLMEPITKNNFRNQIRFCDTCNNQYKLSMQSPNYFISIDISYQIKMLLEDKDILLKLLVNLDLINNSTNSENSSIHDIYDGELYKKLSDIKCSQFKTLTFNFNTDGAALFRSSKLSMWPIQLIINKLPVELRFKTVILAALWISDSEPKPAFMNLYLSTLVESAKELLQSGITIINHNQSIKFNFILLCSSVDSVARPIMQNRMQYNAFQGCSWCYAYGRHVKGAMRYPMSKQDPDLRSQESYLKDVDEAIKLQKIIRGVKGEFQLIKMPLFDSIWGYPIDYMHGILLGVTKQMWDIWTTPVQSVKKSGPLWATSTFPYESNIFHLKQFVNGPKGVRNQIIDKHLRLAKYRHSVATIALSTDDSFQFCKDLFEYRRLMQYTTTESGITFIGKDAYLKAQYFIVSYMNGQRRPMIP